MLLRLVQQGHRKIASKVILLVFKLGPVVRQWITIRGNQKKKKSGFEACYQQMYNEFFPALKQTANQFNFMKDVAEKEKKVQVTQADVLSKCNAGAKKKLSFGEATKGKFLVSKKKKKEPPGRCDACSKTLSRKSDESRHFLMSCKANPSRKSAVQKGKGD